MKSVKYLIMIIGCNCLFAQEIPDFHFKIKSIERVSNADSIYEIKYEPSRRKIYKNLENYKSINKTYLIDSFQVDLRTIDTSLYSNRFNFWTEVHVANGQGEYLRIADINKNGLPELYGYVKGVDYPGIQEGSKVIYELDSLKSKFNLVYNFNNYKDTIFEVMTIYDIKKTGLEQVLWHSYDGIGGISYYAFIPPFYGSLPTKFDFKYQYKYRQLDDFTCGDFDGDNLTDVAFYSMDLYFVVSEYNPIINNLDSIFTFKPISYGGGITSGDLDLDGKKDLVIGDAKGNFYVIENSGNNNYQFVYRGKVETYNAYMNFITNDIDGNGKPELWIGGDAFYSGIPKTIFTCFEMSGDNFYRPVYRIDIVGIFSFFAGNASAFDVDNDGKEELFICIDQHVIILKFIGSPNQHAYEIFYLKRNELIEQNSDYYGATLYDLTGDGNKELLITMDIIPPSKPLKNFTRIYKYNISSDVEVNAGLIISEIELKQNYPNPFNSNTKINFSIHSKNQTNHVFLVVYDILGKEIKVLLNKTLNNGEYITEWDGKDFDGKSVSSGLYFIVLRTNEVKKTIKTLLIK